MWDYNLSRRSLSILYPDGVTTITTTATHFVQEFQHGYGHMIGLSDSDQDEILEKWANLLEGAARHGKKTRQGKEHKSYQTGV